MVPRLDSILENKLILKSRRREQIALKVVVNRRDEYGNTALHLAAWNCKENAFRCLLDCKANPVSFHTCIAQIYLSKFSSYSSGNPAIFG